jgi:hypothetical protein
VTDRRYEPFIDMDRATEATRRRPRTVASPPVQEQEEATVMVRDRVTRRPAVEPPPPPAPEPPAPVPEAARQPIHYAEWARPPVQPAQAAEAPPPDENLWARSDPSRDGERYAGGNGRRRGMVWLVLTLFAIGGSAAYLAYAAVIAPDASSWPGAAAPVATLPDPLSAERLPKRALAVLPVVVAPPVPAVPPPYPAAPQEPVTPPYPAAPPNWTVAPSAWTVVPAVETQHPARHRRGRPVRAHRVEDRPAKHRPRDTRHPLSWKAN